MKLNKKLVVLAAAGALSAVTAFPAMAFENEFHGLYKFKAIVSNLDNGGTAANSTFSVPTLLKEKNQANNYMEQRARVMYIAKASDDLKLVTHFELDARFGGTNGAKYGPVGTSTDAGSLDADGVSLETKQVYLDFNLKPTNFKVGILPYKDALKGIFLDADLAAIATTTKVGNATVVAAFTRVYDGNGLGLAGGTHVGDRNADVFVLDTKYNLNKDVALGLSYYLLANYLPQAGGDIMLHTLSLNGEGKVGPLSLSGFAATQMGTQKDNPAVAGNSKKQFHGYALNAAAKVAIGPGAFRTAALFTSGDGNAADKSVNGWTPVKTVAGTGGSGSSVSTYNEGGMMLLVRNAVQNNTNTDRYIVGTTDNQGKGLFLYSLGYDANITPKFFTNANVGFAWAAKNGIATTNNATNFMGTEINVETGYKLYDNLTTSVQAAYVVLGGAYKGVAAAAKDPENPYTGRLVLTYAF